MSKSTVSLARSKPAKPRPDFPLFPHASGRWAKKVRQKLVYFGNWSDDPKGVRANLLWLDQKEDLLAGRKPRKKAEEIAAGLTVKELCDRFLTAKEHLLDTRELAQRSFDDYRATCLRVAAALGRGRLVSDLRSEDFETLRATLGKNWGPVTLFNEIGRVRILFKWGFDSELYDKPIRFGPGFKRPSPKTLRVARASKGVRMFSQPELAAIMDVAGIQIQAMILLGVNCGLGNSDCARLQFGNLDLEGRWLEFPRPKTGVARRAKLWPETAKAIEAAIASRPTPNDPAHSGLVFITKRGGAWRRETTRDNPLSHEFGKILATLGLKRPGLNFYTLRHVLETIGGECLDQPALDLMMGHASRSDDMSAVYRQGIDDSRLVAVSDHVRAWMFPPKPRTKPKLR